VLAASGRVVMISGANRGIGAAIAQRLAAEGYALSLGLRRPETAPDLPQERCLVARWEATDAASTKSWVAATVERFGRIDALVNNAGIGRPAPIETEDESALDAMWEVNVKGPLRTIRAALPHLKASGSGRVVVVSSLSGKRVKNSNAGYAMTKFAAVALTHAVRQLGWEHGVRATAVCPGFVATDMTVKAPFPRENMIRPEDLAALVATVIALPNTASVAELLVNCQLEAML
jgi:NAD(P)-dependent dehydrogenase (short-subunit alcohol dehydrogenase family)